jgi:hypothetical protein
VRQMEGCAVCMSRACGMSQVTSESTGGVWFAAFHQPEPMSLAKLFGARASRSHASERSRCLGLPDDNNHCHPRIQAIRPTIDSAASHSVLHLPHIVDVGCRGISGEACRYVTQRRRPAWMFRSHARVIETGIRPWRRLFPLWLQ